MTFIETLVDRSRRFAGSRFSAELKMMPSQKTVIIGCVDPRVDPADLFALEPGEAVVIRNVGGRLDPATLETITILQTLAQAAGKTIGDGWTLVVLHHTDCGIVGCQRHAPDLLAHHLGVPRDALDRLAIADPHRAVVVDVDALKANAALPDEMTVVGMVYDVATGKTETVVPSSSLRAAPPASSPAVSG